MYSAINRIKDDNVVIYNDNENVMKWIYHIAHFRASEEEIEKYLSDINYEQRKQKLLENCVIKSRNWRNVKPMKNNKSPGNDSLSAEFYRIFWNDNKEIC